MTKYKCKHETDGVIILDDNEVSLAEYAKEYPENWKRICKGIEKKHWVDHYQKGYSNAMEEVEEGMRKWVILHYLYFGTNYNAIRERFDELLKFLKSPSPKTGDEK